MLFLGLGDVFENQEIMGFGGSEFESNEIGILSYNLEQSNSRKF